MKMQSMQYQYTENVGLREKFQNYIVIESGFPDEEISVAYSPTYTRIKYPI